jgi:hypothetical protein
MSDQVFQNESEMKEMKNQTLRVAINVVVTSNGLLPSHSVHTHNHAAAIIISNSDDPSGNDYEDK